MITPYKKYQKNDTCRSLKVKELVAWRYNRAHVGAMLKSGYPAVICGIKSAAILKRPYENGPKPETA